jgi:hypothetical protein
VTGKEIGMAADFYRLRVIQMDAGDLPDLEWREDILYREPPTSEPREYEAYVVQAVNLESEDAVTALATFSEHEQAHEWLEGAEDDLRDLTRSEFEARYFSGGTQPRDAGAAPSDG